MGIVFLYCVGNQLLGFLIVFFMLYSLAVSNICRNLAEIFNLKYYTKWEKDFLKCLRQ